MSRFRRWSSWLGCALLGVGASGATCQLLVPELVSQTSSGDIAEGTGLPWAPSGDGRFVPFTTTALNLGSNYAGDYAAFLRDRDSQTTEPVSVDSAGNPAHPCSGDVPMLNAVGGVTPDGRYVAFTSNGCGLRPAGWVENADRYDVFVRDRVLGQTEIVSVRSNGLQGNAASVGLFFDWLGAPISDDARYVTFASLASDLVAGDTNGVEDVFVRDRQAGTTSRVSLLPGGGQSASAAELAGVSGDGRHVLFRVVEDVGPGQWGGPLFVRDRSASTTAAAGSAVFDSTVWGNLTAISGDGTIVAQVDVRDDLVAGDSNGAADVFVLDRTSGAIARASVSSTGTQANAASANVSLSSDGRFVAFDSQATNLAPGGGGGVFVHDRVTHRTVAVPRVDGEPGGLGRISSDGRWVSFAATVDASGQIWSEVYVVENPLSP